MKFVGAAAAVLLGLFSTAMAAEKFPSKAVTIVVPFSPGGSNDIVGRYLGDGLSKLWKQSVVVENRPGAGGAIGYAYVSQAKPDGYTLLVASVTFTMTPAVMKNLPYDPKKDFKPVAILGKVPMIVGVGPAIPANTMEEFIEYAKAKPPIYADTGAGGVSQFAAELINLNAGLKMTPAHYKGGSQAVTDVIGGHVGLYIGSMTEMLPYVRAGQVKGLAVTSRERSAAVPDVPTLAESGVPNSEIEQWWSILVPAGTPDEIVTKLNADINSVMGSEDAKKFLAQNGGVQAIMKVPEATEFVRSEIQKWDGVAKQANITAD